MHYIDRNGKEEYIDRQGAEDYIEPNKFTKSMEKKLKLIIYFKRYMSEHLVKAGGDSARGISDHVSRIPHLHTWFRTTCAVVMHLTNGSVQVSIFTDMIYIKIAIFDVSVLLFL